MTNKSSSRQEGVRFISALSLLLALAGCNYTHPKVSEENIQANLESIQRDFVDVRCVRCHTEATAANRYVSLIDITQSIETPKSGPESRPRYLIKPGCPKQSFFLSIIKEGKMPPGGGVSPKAIEAIEKYITSLNPHAGTDCSDEPPGDETDPGEPGD